MATEHLSFGEDWLARLSALSDRSRIRILRVLEQEELGVGELSNVLAMPQSTVSRHLKPLHELGLVSKRSEGTASLYRMSMQDEADIALWRTTSERLGSAEDLADDDARLRTVLRERQAGSHAFFGRIGAEWQSIRRELFGTGFTDDALLSFIPEDWVVADLGCGSGDVAERLASVVAKVYAIDREPAMLTAAKRRLELYENIEFLEASLLDLPIEDNALDAAVLMLVMHHQDDPKAIMAETNRVLKRHGKLMVVDMTEHDRSDFAQEMGHVHLGFNEATVRAWEEATDLSLQRYRRLRPSVDGRGPGLFSALFTKK